MRSRFLVHPVLIMLVIVAFSLLATGCTRTVTKYDKDGKPYSEQETDPVATLAAVILGSLILGAISIAAAGGGSYLPGQNRPMFADAGGNVMSDFSSRNFTFSSVRCIKLMDAQGNLISKHVIDVDKLRAGGSLVNISDVQISSEINKKALRRLANEIAKANNLTSVPKSVKTEVSYFSGSEDVMRLDAVSIPKDRIPEKGDSELTVMSDRGIYKTTTTLNENQQEEDSRQLSITVSNLN